MSGQHPRGGAPYRHPTHRALWAAAAAIIVLAVGACSSTTSMGTSPTAVAATSIGPAGHKPTLTGAGSTFDAPFFAVAFASYQQQHPSVTIGYSAVGSSAGIAAISAQQVDFGASDVPMTATEQAAAKGGPITQVPVDLGGEGVAYNLSLPAGARLHLTGPVLAAIFLGQITHWNDPALTALNPGLTLPTAAINVVHRSDGSGTTYIFSNYLSSIDPAWASKVGTGKTLNWLVGDGEEGNGGVATAVDRTPFSIGYIEQAYSQGLLLPFAAIRNQAGNYVIPSAQSVAADAARKPGITAVDFSIVNQPGATSYPISGYSWALVYTHQPGQARGQALVAMLDWLTHDGQAYAAANGRSTAPISEPGRISATAGTCSPRSRPLAAQIATRTWRIAADPLDLAEGGVGLHQEPAVPQDEPHRGGDAPAVAPVAGDAEVPAAEHGRGAGRLIRPACRRCFVHGFSLRTGPSSFQWRKSRRRSRPGFPSGRRLTGQADQRIVGSVTAMSRPGDDREPLCAGAVVAVDYWI